jgi:cytohesin
VLPLLLAAQGVDVNAQSGFKRWRPIDVCNTAEAARMLLDAGAVQSAAAPGLLSALHHAAFQARADVVELLLSRGASVSETFSPEGYVLAYAGHFGGTALHLAASSIGSALIAREMMGAQFGLLAPEMAHAQEAATRRAAVCTALLRAGADINALTSPVADDSPNYKPSPLVLAAQAGDAAVIRVLLRAGAPANAIENGTGWSALHFAAQQGHTEAIHALVGGGADVDQPVGVFKHRHNRPLMRAVFGNHHGAVRALLELGADSSQMAFALSRPPALLLPTVVDDTTRALVARHRRGQAAPARACSLPECEARRRVDYDDKKLMMCPCKVRAAAASLGC